MGMLHWKFLFHSQQFQEVYAWARHELPTRAAGQDEPRTTRQNKSSTDDSLPINSFGRSLLSLCSALDLYILNGSTPDGNSGHFTNISVHFSSVVDYVICSNNIVDLFNPVKNEDNVLSSHMPIEWNLKCNLFNMSDTTTSTDKCLNEKPVTRYTWMTKRIPVYTEKILTYLNRENINEPIDIKNVTESISANFIEASQFLQSSTGAKRKSRKSPWFDKECSNAKRKLRLFYVYTEIQTLKTIRCPIWILERHRKG